MVSENRFARGINTDTDPALLPADMARDAVNMELTAENGYHAMVNLKGTDLKYRLPLTPEQLVPDVWPTLSYPARLTQALAGSGNYRVVGTLDFGPPNLLPNQQVPPLPGSGTNGAIKKGDIWIVSVGGSGPNTTLAVGDWIWALVDDPTTDADYQHVTATVSPAKTAAENAADIMLYGDFATKYEPIISSHGVTAKYYNVNAVQEYLAPSLFVITYRKNVPAEEEPTIETNNVYLLNSATGRLHLIFTGWLHMAPNVLNPAASAQTEIREVDAYSTEENGERYAYWVDNENPLRVLRLFVSDDTRFDCADGSASPFNGVVADTWLYHDQDLLSGFKLFPPDALAVDGVVPEGGNLVAGSYQFAYRLVNTHANVNSKFTLFTNPIPIIDPVTNASSGVEAAEINDIYGSLPGAVTRKAIRVRIDPHPKTGDFSRMRGYYNAVQLAIVKNTDGRVQAQDIAFLLEPSTEFYDTLEYTYTGTEKEVQEVASTLTTPEAALLSAKTIEYNDGRLFLANVRYRTDRATPTLTGAKTKQKFLRVRADPMKSESPSDPTLQLADSGDFINTEWGYYSELNCHLYKGHWRGELYRDFLVYADKFGNFCEPAMVDFSDTTTFPRATPTRSTPTGTLTVTSGTLSVTKNYNPVGGGSSYFFYGTINGQGAFLHAKQSAPGSTLDVLGGYFLDFSQKFYSGTTVTFTASPSPSDIGVAFTLSSGTLNVADVNGLDNWADPASKDWKFPARTDPAGHLFDQWVWDGPGATRLVEDYVRVLGLELQGIANHPDWAVCVACVRLERKRNILGQTPMVHAAAVQNIPTMWNVNVDVTTPSNPQPVNLLNQFLYPGNPGDPEMPDDYNPDFRNATLNYDYDGAQDTLVPRFLAYGPTRHLCAFNIPFKLNGSGFSNVLHFNDWFLLWQKTETLPGQASQLNPTYAPAFNGYFLYVPEYMAHLGSITRDTIFLDGTEFLDCIDVVALEAFNALRNGPTDLLTPDVETGATNFFKGDYKRYAWVFSPYGHDAYFSSGARDAHYYRSLYTKIPSIGDTYTNPMLLKKGVGADFGHEPFLLDDSYVRRIGYTDGNTQAHPSLAGNGLFQYGQDFRRIRLVDNLHDLVQQGMEAQQAANNIREAGLIPPLPENNQRLIFATVDDGDSVFVYDPTDALTQSEFSAYFGTGYDGTVTVNRKLDQESWWTSDSQDAIGELLNTSNDNQTKLANIHNSSLDHNYMVIPGNCTLMPVGNVVKRLDDFRYGSEDISSTAFYTGAYQALDLGPDPQNPDPNAYSDGLGEGGVTLEVFGGDCYVSRFPTTIRDNSVAVRDMLLKDPTGIISGTTAITHVNRAENYSSFVEIIDLWLESEVNGHYVDNSNNLYPYRVRDRDANGGPAVRVDNTKARDNYQYPDIATDKLYVAPRQYQYNQGYSTGNLLKTFTTLPAEFPRLQTAPARVHWSAKQVRNTQTRGFDTWLVDDFSDELDLFYGPVTKLMFQGNNRVLAFQEKGVPVLMVGSVQSYDVNGNAIGLSSGQVIGNVSYLNTAAGTKYLSSVRRMDGIVYFFDSLNVGVSAVSGNEVRSLSDGRVRTLARQLFASSANSATYGNVVGWADALGKKYCLYDNGRFLFNDFSIPAGIRQGIVWNALAQAWECRLVAAPHDIAQDMDFQVAYVNRVAAGQYSWDAVNKWFNTESFGTALGNGEIHVFSNTDRSLMFGGNKEQSITLVANQPYGLRKTFDVVLMVGSGVDIASGRSRLRVSVPDASLDTGVIPFRKDRETMYLANQMRDQTTKARMRGQWAQEILIFATADVPEPNEIVVRSVRTKDRESPRTER